MKTALKDFFSVEWEQCPRGGCLAGGQLQQEGEQDTSGGVDTGS